LLIQIKSVIRNAAQNSECQQRMANRKIQKQQANRTNRTDIEKEHFMHMNRRRQLKTVAFQTGLIGLLSISSVYGSAIAVPDGNFSQASGTGTVGGGLIAQSGSQTIGTGPWTGSYDAVAGLLVPPSLTIASIGGVPSGGYARISGLLGISVLGSFLDNGGQFSQTIAGVNYQANTTYTLSANVDVGTLLGAGALTLANGGVGIGLLNGGTPLVDSRNAALVLSVALLSGTTYQLQMQYTTGAIAPVGNLGIRLFDSPSGLAQANLLNSVTFSNVTLDATSAAATPEPSSSVLLLLGGGFCAFAKGMTKRRAQRSSKSAGKES